MYPAPTGGSELLNEGNKHCDESETKEVQADLKATKVHDQQLRSAAVKAGLWDDQVGRFQVNLQIQNLPGFDDVGQTCIIQSQSETSQIQPL